MDLLHAFEPATGGVAAYVTAVARVQARRGHRVVVLAPDTLEERYRAALAGCEVVTWRPARRSGRSLWRAARRFQEVVGAHRPRVLHLHSSVAGVLLRVVGRAPVGTALLYQPHGLPFSMAGRLAPALEAVERVLSRRTDALLAVSEDEARALRRAGVRAPVATTSVPVDLEWFRPASATQRLAARERLALPGGVRAVVSVGRITRAKGQDLLVQDWLRHHPTLQAAGAQLFLVGAGDTSVLAGWAGKALGSSVHHVGDVEDVRPWLAVAEVVAQASRWEGMSLSVAEALASGVPVVANDVAGMREMIGTGSDAAGAVVGEEERPATLVPRVLARLQSMELQEEERRAARRRALELFEPDRVVDRLEDAYGQAMSRSLRP